MRFDRDNAKALGRKGGLARVRKARLASPLDVSAYVGRPVAFLEALTDPETGEAFRLYPEQRAFVEAALTLTPEGRLPFPELLFSAPKKSGKTTLAGGVVLYVVLVAAWAAGDRNPEAIILANDLEQAQSRVFAQIVKIVKATPWLKPAAVIRRDRVFFPALAATIQAIASDAPSAAGGNPVVSAFDELWGFTSERSHRLWDESVPPPTRKVACRLTTTYAGFSGESKLLEGLVTRVQAAPEIAPELHAIPGELLGFLTHRPVAPWQTEAWLAQMRHQLRPGAYLRMIENRFVTSEEAFVPEAWWAACEWPELHPVLTDKQMSVWVGVDASVKRDSSAVVAVTWRADVKRVRLVWHRIYQPSPEDPLDFELTLEAAILDLRQRFRVVAVRFDPYQMVSSAQRLTRAGVPMKEFPQSVPNLTEASQGLYDAIKGTNLEVYPDDDVRRAVHRAVAIESSRGWRIGKQHQTHKIDIVVALAMAVLGAVKGATSDADTDCAVVSMTRPSIWSGHHPELQGGGTPRELQSIYPINGGGNPFSAGNVGPRWPA